MNPGLIAIDLGAESGRVIVVEIAGHLVRANEIHRFKNQPIQLPTGLHWDITSLWREIVVGLTKVGVWSQAHQVHLLSVGVDAWGVDWSLLSASGELIGLPHAYRDDRYPAACEQALQLISAAELYEITGIQLMPINSVFSLYAQVTQAANVFCAANQIAFIPDLFHYWLSGSARVEATIASTSQLVDIRSGNWSATILRKLGIDERLFPVPSPPGTKLGRIRADLAQQCGLPGTIEVIQPASHDTACAVAAVPAKAGSNWCYLSSGTWSLLGAELDAPCLSSQAKAAMFTNELGVNTTIRFLKNIAGLWLLQQVRNDFAQSGTELDYSQLTMAAESAEPFRSIVDVNDPEFQSPGAMRQKIAEACVRTGTSPPRTVGEYARCCLESLALAYRATFGKLCRILERDFDIVHIVGGGSQNGLLNQLTADALNRSVVAGPAEATALGNGLVQAIAMGQLDDLEHLRTMVRESETLTQYQPHDAERWKRAIDRFDFISS